MQSIWTVHRAATRKACAVAACAVAVVLSLPPLLGQFYFGMDLTRTNLGMICAIKDRLAHHAPLDLSPLLGNGGVLLARPEASLFYPVRWLAVMLPADWGVAFEIIFHLTVAAATVAWLARTFGIRPFTAAGVGIAFALSGTSIDLIRHAIYMVAAAWLPLVWAGARELLRRRGGRLALFAVFGGLLACLLGGEPQSFGIGLGLIGVELLTALARKRRPNRKWLALAVSAGAAFLIGLVQWIPTLTEMGLTPRSGNLGLADALAWSLAKPLWIGVLLPGMPCQYVEGVTSLFGILSPETDAPWNKTPYLGPLLLLGAILGAGLRRARSASIVALGATILSLGEELPILPFLMKVLPFMARFRTPSKYWLIATLAITIVAAIAIDGLPRRRALRRRLVWGGAVIIAALTVFGAWVFLNADELNLAARRLGQPMGELGLPTLSSAVSSSILEALIPLAIALGLLWHVRLRRLLFGMVVLGTIAALPYALLVGPGLADVGGAHRPSLIAPEPPAVVCVDPSALGGAYPVKSGTLDWWTMRFLSTHLLPETQACAGVRSGIIYSPMEASTALPLGAGVRRHNSAAIRAFGCTHYLSPTRFGPDVPASEARFEVPYAADGPAEWGGSSIFQLLDPVPPVFVARDPALSATETDAIARISRTRSSPDLLQVIDDPLRRLGLGGLPSGAGVTAVAAEPTQLSSAMVRIAGTGGAVVGLRTPFLVGWHATQADRPLPVVRVAGHQLGAVVEDVAAGPVLFEYRTPGLTVGLGAALAGLMLIAAALALVSKRPFVAPW